MRTGGVLCEICRNVRDERDTKELELAWGHTREAPRTQTGIYACKWCAPWDGRFPATKSSHDPLLLRLREELLRAMEQTPDRLDLGGIA